MYRWLDGVAVVGAALSHCWVTPHWIPIPIGAPILRPELSAVAFVLLWNPGHPVPSVLLGYSHRHMCTPQQTRITDVSTRCCGHKLGLPALALYSYAVLNLNPGNGMTSF